VMTPIESIEGRSDDIFRLLSATGDGSVLIFPDFIRRAVIAASNNIEEYRVIQTEKGQIVVQLKVKNQQELVEQQVVDKLLELFQSFKVQLPTIITKPYEKQSPLKK